MHHGQPAAPRRAAKGELMRVLVVTNLYPNPCQPHRAAFNRQLFHALSSRHELRVVAPIAWTDELLERSRNGRRLCPRRVEAGDGIVVDHPRYLFPPKLLRGLYGRCYRYSIRAAVRQAVLELRPQIIFASWAYPDGWAAVELGHRAGLPVVVKVHGSDVLLLGGRTARRRRTKEALTGADAVVAVSQDLAGHVAELGVPRERVHVIYNGIDTDLFRSGPPDRARAKLRFGSDGEPLILYVGNLVPVKGLDILIDACGMLHRDGARFRCCLVGQGPLESRLRRKAARLGLQERIALLGPRPHTELPDWYQAATVFVLPSYSEGVPNVLLEAAACGTPFIASRVGGISEIAHGDRDQLIPPGDARALAEAMRQALLASGRAVVPPVPRAQSWADSAEQLTQLFESLVA